MEFGQVPIDQGSVMFALGRFLGTLTVETVEDMTPEEREALSLLSILVWPQRWIMGLGENKENNNS